MRATLRFDGGCRPTNPGPAAGAYVLVGEGGSMLSCGAKYIGEATNNVAEYTGLILGLQAAIDHKVTHLTVIGDSQLIINQMAHRWKVKQPDLQTKNWLAASLAAKIDHIDWRWQRRANNGEADALCTKAIEEHQAAGGSMDYDLPEEFLVEGRTQMSLRREGWFGNV